MKKASIPLKSATASLYLRASAKKRKEANELANLWIKDFLSRKRKEKDGLFEMMDIAGKMAKRNGLTEEKLQDILTELEAGK